MLENPNEPVSDLSYFDCIESVMENSKVSLSVFVTFLTAVIKHPTEGNPKKGGLVWA